MDWGQIKRSETFSGADTAGCVGGHIKSREAAWKARKKGGARPLHDNENTRSLAHKKSMGGIWILTVDSRRLGAVLGSMGSTDEEDHSAAAT